MTALTLVVPCYNEATRLTPASWLAWLDEAPDRRLLFVDDGSTDGTAELLRSLAHPRAESMRLPTNVGKGEAVRLGLLAAAPGGGLIGWWDADLATPLGDAERLCQAFHDQPDLWVALGSRVAILGAHIERNPARHYAGRVAATLASWVLGLAVYDTQCGAKVLRPTAEVLSALERPWLYRWTFDVELLARLLDAHPAAADHLREVPLRAWRDVSGSKVRWTDMLLAPWWLLRIGLARQRNHQRVTKTTSP